MVAMERVRTAAPAGFPGKPPNLEPLAMLAGSRYAPPTLALLAQLRRHHPASADHSIRVARAAMAMWAHDPEGLGERDILLVGGVLHDIGKLFVPATTLGSDRRLDATERTLIQRHPETGAQVLRVLGFPPLIVAAARDHHEHWNGGGYPRGCRGEDLHPITRTIAVADAFVAMVEPGRAYRAPLGGHAALAEIAACRGTQFDPAAADLLQASFAGMVEPAELVCRP